MNVLIATAVVEEGLDIPECNLVFRFNKPPNFSSYMQSKGRARAKENASYVLLIAEPDPTAFQRDLVDYRNYEEIEQVSILTSNRNSSTASFSIIFRCFTTSFLSVMAMNPTRAIWMCWNLTELRVVLRSVQSVPLSSSTSESCSHRTIGIVSCLT